MAKTRCDVHKLGLVGYQEAWDLQNHYAAEIASGDRPPTLLLLEHPHTYTFGRRGDAANLLWGQGELRRRGISVHWVDRGGDVTYHGPGQLVGYPLLPLGRPSVGGSRIPAADYVGYIRRLEQVIITALGSFGVAAKQVSGLTGVWVDRDQIQRTQDPGSPSIHDQGSPILKLAAIGVKVDARGISRHGFALNVDPDMSYWEGIVGCGLPHPEVSLAGLVDPVPSMADVGSEVLKSFSKAFGYRVVILAADGG